jgi:hypothetical protein
VPGVVVGALCISSVNTHNKSVDAVFTVLQMRKLRYKNAECLAQGHMHK